MENTENQFDRKADGLSLLGNAATKYPDDYAPGVLETFENKHKENDYFVKFNCPEFTSLCPITGQPDFAAVTISCKRCVYSASSVIALISFACASSRM